MEKLLYNSIIFLEVGLK